MPRNKDLKRVIRRRMKKTGESYTASRAQILSKTHVKRSPAPAADLGALAGMSDGTIAARTGRTWREWTRVLDAEGAMAMPHREIASLLHRKHGVADWWSQTVTVGYERIKGLRERGQRLSGAYEASKSRTFDVPVKTLFHAWADGATRRRWIRGVDTTVRTATAPKSLRLQWPDGTIVAAWFSPKGGAKSAVALAHTKLRDRASSEQSKKDWAARLDALGHFLTTTGGGTSTR
jgi:hypothetical protein